MRHQLVIVLDLGGRHNQLIARRIRACGVYCEVRPYTTPLEELKTLAPIGIILIGGPGSVWEAGAPRVDPALFTLGLPVLGVGYGCQVMACALGGDVTAAAEGAAGEYDKSETFYDGDCALFKGLPAHGLSYMSQGDEMTGAPEGCSVVARTQTYPIAAIADAARSFYGVQFHPEVGHTENGMDMIRNFLFGVCKAVGDWDMADYLKDSVSALRERIGDRKVLLALSGGVDSSVCAALLDRAVGEQLTCIFVDHGLLRKHEGDDVAAAFAGKRVKFVRVD
ncbi:MAG: glutamine-hydrolyzing GMP synthase, partial [Clostridiales bacterium]|nr:glutamine-hydrolyzing GMP synthase [Clostridiales bacterium]